MSIQGGKMVEGNPRPTEPQPQRFNPRVILLHVKTYRREWDQLTPEAQALWNEYADAIVASSPENARNFERYKDPEIIPDKTFDWLCNQAVLIEQRHRLERRQRLFTYDEDRHRDRSHSE